MHPTLAKTKYPIPIRASPQTFCTKSGNHLNIVLSSLLTDKGTCQYRVLRPWGIQIGFASLCCPQSRFLHTVYSVCKSYRVLKRFYSYASFVSIRLVSQHVQTLPFSSSPISYEQHYIEYPLATHMEASLWTFFKVAEFGTKTPFNLAITRPLPENSAGYRCPLAFTPSTRPHGGWCHEMQKHDLWLKVFYHFCFSYLSSELSRIEFLY